MCKHVWHKACCERGISKGNPRFYDDITVGIYCPKCLTTKFLTFQTMKERTNNSDIDEKTFHAIEAWDAPTPVKASEAMNPLKIVENIKTNLMRLEYKLQQIATIMSPNPKTGKLDFKTFKSRLKVEHYAQAGMIFKGDLIN